VNCSNNYTDLFLILICDIATDLSMLIFTYDMEFLGDKMFYHAQHHPLLASSVSLGSRYIVLGDSSMYYRTNVINILVFKVPKDNIVK